MMGFAIPGMGGLVQHRQLLESIRTILQLTRGDNIMPCWTQQPWPHDLNEMAFGKPVVYMGEGGTIPFMGMLGAKFPETQFVITGVLGPHSNAHGPNEFLHIKTGERVTTSIAQIIADHYKRPDRKA